MYVHVPWFKKIGGRHKIFYIMPTGIICQKCIKMSTWLVLHDWAGYMYCSLHRVTTLMVSEKMFLFCTKLLGIQYLGSNSMDGIK